ncbi:MAG TPA: phosphomethylpyrimidine synthase ThiC [Thermoanaerobaculia bacterium]|nr:phosphomethylpyrimidine synthase ThiC [Thermoanaerobaculia bacterium]
MSHRTQLQAARAGIVTPQMRTVAADEGIPVESLREAVAAGRVVIPANRLHASLHPAGIGAGLRTKINVNLGISRDCPDIAREMEKVDIAIGMKADAIMDLSCDGDTRDFRRRVVERSSAMVGSVPAYDVLGCFPRDFADITGDDWFSVVEEHVRSGVDFITVHAGMNRESARRLERADRITNIVSRGGSLLFAWMKTTGRENPFFEHYDRLLDLCAAYDVTISLGDAGRPGCTHDATDGLQVGEMLELGDLTRRAWDRGVQVMIEGPGHMALDQIAANVLLEKRLCHGAPFYVLGPLVTDVAPGYDHITSAIGGAIAAAAGADFLCYVTPAEHLRLPTLDDVKEGIVASRIAAHAADLVKGVRGAQDWDDRMSRARHDLDWEKMFALAIDPEKARRYRAESLPEDEDTCTMCGRLCAVRTMNEALRA